MGFFSKKKYMNAYMVIPCIYPLRCGLGLGHSVQEAFDRTKLRVAGGGEGKMEGGWGCGGVTI